LADIVYIIDKRLNDHGKYWRHVYKTLIVLEYAICCGSEAIVSYAKERLHEIATLREFRAVNETGLDNGACVREKSKDIVALLSDEERLLTARRTKTLPMERRHSAEPLQLSAAERRSSAISIQKGESRRGSSFEHLQAVDEDEAMALALAASKVDMRVGEQTVMEDFLEHASRSVSHRSSGRDSQVISPKEGGDDKGKMSAGQLLDMDDEQFEQMLGSASFSRKGSLDLHSLLNQPASRSSSHGAVNYHYPDHGHLSFNDQPSNGHASNGSPSNGYQHAYGEPMQHDDQVKDPFEEQREELAERAFARTMHRAPLRVEPQGIHPIAIPMNQSNELTVGAKPVMPGTNAPQYGYKANGDPTVRGHQQEVEGNQPSGTVDDPFADLV